MNAPTFSMFGALTKDQALRVWEIWHDPTEPSNFVYCIQDGQVVGRGVLDRKPNDNVIHCAEIRYGALPPPVTSAIKDPAPISRRDLLHELPAAMRPAAAPRRQAKPKPRRRSIYTRGDLMRGLFLIAVLVYAYIQFG